MITIRYPQDAGKKFEMFRYPGGEVQVRILESQIEEIAAAHNIHVVAQIRDGEIMGLAQLTDALNGLTSADKTLIMPYLPYSRADRQFSRGDCCGLEVFAEQINSLCYERIVTLDAHSDAASEYVMNLINVSPRPIIAAVIDRIDGPGSLVSILLPDAGACFRYGISTSLAASKKRDPITGKLTGFYVPPKEAFTGLDSVLIVDDICDGGGTFIGIAEQLADYGLPLYLYVTHGIFSKGMAPLIPHFKHIFTTDSFGRESTSDRVTILPCMPTILADLFPTKVMGIIYLTSV